MLFLSPYYLTAFSFLIGAAVGNIFYRSDYCMSGMFRDIFLLKSASLLRSLFFMASFAMVFFFMLRQSGIITNYPPPSYSSASIATLSGGLIFGVGMVLAGGCVVGTLYKMAKGNIANAAAFFGIIGGSLMYVEMHPYFEVIRKKTAMTKAALIPETFPQSELVLIFTLALVSAICYMRWKRLGLLSYNGYAEGYLSPLKASLMLALLNAAIYAVWGWPMGITTAYTKLGAYIENVIAPSHVANLAYFREPSIVALRSGVRIEGGAAPQTDLISYTELPFLLGIISGAFLTAFYLREFKIYGAPPLRQMLSAIAGGIMLGFGSRLAGGCNLKFIAGGLPLLSYQAVIFVLAMTAGAYLGTVLLRRVILKT